MPAIRIPRIQAKPGLKLSHPTVLSLPLGRRLFSRQLAPGFRMARRPRGYELHTGWRSRDLSFMDRFSRMRYANRPAHSERMERPTPPATAVAASVAMSHRRINDARKHLPRPAASVPNRGFKPTLTTEDLNRWTRLLTKPNPRRNPAVQTDVARSLPAPAKTTHRIMNRSGTRRQSPSSASCDAGPTMANLKRAVGYRRHENVSRGDVRRIDNAELHQQRFVRESIEKILQKLELLEVRWSAPAVLMD